MYWNIWYVHWNMYDKCIEIYMIYMYKNIWFISYWNICYMIFNVLNIQMVSPVKLKNESLSLKMTIRRLNERRNSVMWKMIVRFRWRGSEYKDILEMAEICLG